MTENVLSIPALKIPTNRKDRAVALGNVVSGEEKYSQSAYVTDNVYGISDRELRHIVITGDGKTGKTEAAMRAVAEIYRGMKFQAKSGELVAPSLVVFDHDQNWRKLKYYTSPGEFHHYTYDSKLNPLRMNLLHIPNGVQTNEWIRTFSESFCIAYGMDKTEQKILEKHLEDLYEDVRAFEKTENSRKVTLDDLYILVSKTNEDIDQTETNTAIKGAYHRLLNRLVSFHMGMFRDFFCYSGEEAVGIGELCRERGHITVIETSGMEFELKQFVTNMISNGVYKYGIGKGGFDGRLMLVADDGEDLFFEYPTMRMDSLWEVMFAEAAGWNMNLCVITQNVQSLPGACLTNTSMVLVLQTRWEPNIDTMAAKLSGDARREEIASWLRVQPQGWAVVRSTLSLDKEDTEPSIIAISPLTQSTPSDDEMREYVTGA